MSSKRRKKKRCFTAVKMKSENMHKIRKHKCNFKSRQKKFNGKKRNKIWAIGSNYNQIGRKLSRDNYQK